MEKSVAELSLLAKLYTDARRDCKTLMMADCLLYASRRLDAWEDASCSFMLKGHAALLYAAMYYLRSSELKAAAEYLTAYGRLVERFACGFQYEYFVLGARICHAMGDNEQAADFMERYCEHITVDDEANLFLGSLLCSVGRYEQGREMFVQMLTKNPCHPEAAVNLALLDAALAAGHRSGLHVDYLRHLFYAFHIEDVKLPAGDGWRDIPIIINSRDRLECLKQLVSWLLQAGYRRIYIFDNASTYKPLLAYYDAIEQQAGVEVLRMSNLGHMALWQADVLYKLGINGMFVYTDSDIVPVAACPPDVVRHLAELLDRYPDMDKAGLGLVTEDILDDYCSVKEHEAGFYHVPLEKDVWFAPMDTTFALYRPRCPYRMMKSIRTTGDMMVRHLPWYMDKNNLPEDEQYYVEHANSSSTWAGNLRTLRSQGD